ncbi:hypothetical protein L249_0413 [Ophiocordyceps polyrhachis-furcata BCC 54312]|uniref:Chalcone isomerase domain-containing protein n=1 Tax=Ophiocordyceps polyrhachis-furcata BCC 54312 TaxID=1330021 RepID=A0A367LDJ7_9HYPO|nr:hypothetical protein L249_0413 [Ophiocordyceps polyrhachis-furcata BCC 54312]
MPTIQSTALLRPALRCPGRTLAARRTLFSAKQPDRVARNLDLNRLHAKRRDYERNRTAFLAAGAIAGLITCVYTAWKLKEALDRKQKVLCDSTVPAETHKVEAGEKRKVVVIDEQGREIVPTGDSVVAAFPRTMAVHLPTETKQEGKEVATVADKDGVEFTLVGLGMRSVTFIGFRVYLVGFYVATQDIARLQKYLIKKVNPLATTLIASEKETLRKALLDAVEGEETWDAMLRETGCRSVFRIMPVRDTDFHHLRDGFVRAVQTRSLRDKTCQDDAFGSAMKDFKTMFNRGTMAKTKELLLHREADGKLSVLYGDGSLDRDADRKLVGVVGDERLSRLLWLNYLAGKQVASEPARQNIIEGVMEFMARPIGTVATQVV